MLFIFSVIVKNFVLTFMTPVDNGHMLLDSQCCSATPAPTYIHKLHYRSMHPPYCDMIYTENKHSVRSYGSRKKSSTVNGRPIKRGGGV